MSRHINQSSKAVEALLSLQNTDEGKLIFTHIRQHSFALLLQKGKLKAARVLPATAGKNGGIYIGKVKNIAHGLNACFIEIAPGEICFMRLSEPVFFLLNRSFDGRLLQGDELPVQVIKDAQKNKPATVSTRLTVSNEYLVLSLSEGKIRFSQKLSKRKQEEIRQNFLTRGLIDADGTALSVLAENQKLPHSILIRTQAGLCTEEELLQKYESSMKKFNTLLQNAVHRVCFSCLVQPPPSFQSVLEQLVSYDEYEEILIDEPLLYEQLFDYVRQTLPAKNVRLYTDSSFPLAKLYALEDKLDSAVSRKVWLKSGGYLIIDRTEALTVIDVNSGKCESKKPTEEAVLQLNTEAAAEIMLQLRLRNISGIIVVDFINMKTEEQKKTLLHCLRRLADTDRQKTLIVDITPLGLVEITRQKNSKSLYEQLQE